MSYEHGMSALNLEMPEKIPRTEYSAHFHWELVNKITGLAVDSQSSEEEKTDASRKFMKAWDYGLFWNINPYDKKFGNKRTKMGHAVYQQNGVDFSDKTEVFIEDPEDVYEVDFYETYGVRDQKQLIADFDQNYQKMVKEHSDMVNMTGIYTTCMSGLIEILGWDILLTAAGIDNRAFGEFMNRYAEWNMQYFEALAECESPVVMVHDDIVWTSGAFIAPDFYRTYVFPNLKKMLEPLHEKGKKVLFTSDGDYTQFVDDIAACHVHGFVMEPCTNMSYICEKYGKTHSIIGNVDTRILLSGSKADIESEVKRCIHLGKKCPGYFMAVGNHIPPNTPVDNCMYYQEFYEKYSRR